MGTLPKRIRQCARLTGQFVLRSGKVSDTYFDKYQFEADPELLRDIAEEMATLVPPHAEVLAGLEIGGIPIVTMLSQVTGLPAAFIRKEPKSTAHVAMLKAPRWSASASSLSRTLCRVAVRLLTPWTS